MIALDAIDLPRLPAHPVLRDFATSKYYLRPSKVADFISCPLAVMLEFGPATDTLGGVAAQTGNLVHTGVQAYHTQTGEENDRVAAGLAALAAAREKFPQGDQTRANRIYTNYTRDPKNITAKVKWVEQRVRLVLKAEPYDPTGEDIVIDGTLDQVRWDGEHLSVWDIKTGERLSANEVLDEHIVQQSVYVLAARKSLDASIEPGGLIYTPGYEITRGRTHLPYQMTVADCEATLSMVPILVAHARAGRPLAHPSLESCRYCEHKKYPKCLGKFKGMY